MNTCCVYILPNQYHPVPGVGVTNNPQRQGLEHKPGQHQGLTNQYNLRKRACSETSPTMQDAVARQKQLKAGSRARKRALVNELNPTWQDLMADY